jgi:hypothetical protein
MYIRMHSFPTPKGSALHLFQQRLWQRAATRFGKREWVSSARDNSNICTNFTYSTNTKYYVESFINIADVLHITRFQSLNFYTRTKIKWQLSKLRPLIFTFQITHYASLHPLWAQVNQPTCYAWAFCAKYYLVAKHCSITWARASSPASFPFYRPLIRNVQPLCVSFYKRN